MQNISHDEPGVVVKRNEISKNYDGHSLTSVLVSCGKVVDKLCTDSQSVPGSVGMQ